MLFSIFSPEGLDGAVNVGVLLEPRGGGEGLATFRTRMAPGPHVVGPDVPLQVGGIGEDFVAVLAGEPPVLAVLHLVFQEVGPPGKRLRAVLAAEL